MEVKTIKCNETHKNCQALFCQVHNHPEWRVSDSLTLRRFLGYALDEQTPDHSSLSRIRHRLPLEVHEAVFKWILRVLCKAGLVKGKTLGVDATTLEANAAMRSIVRRDTGEGQPSDSSACSRPRKCPSWLTCDDSPGRLGKWQTPGPDRASHQDEPRPGNGR